MRRIQIRLSETQERAVRSRAARTGKSVSAIIRDAIDRLVASEAGRASHHVLAVFGKYRSRGRDTSVRHDRYLADAFDK